MRYLSELTVLILGLGDSGLAMARWCAEAGLSHAPHGKTTMAPQLWDRQLRAGAWAITLANLPQLRVAHAFGVPRVILANELNFALVGSEDSTDNDYNDAVVVINWPLG